MEQLFFFLTLFLLGAAHGIEPGHGKLLVTSYLAGNNADLKHALFLGLLVAVVHTLSVAVIGGVVVFLAVVLFKDAFLSSLEMISGLVILGLGIVLFWKRFVAKAKVEEHCDCHIIHASPVPVTPQQETSTLKDVFLLGFASGLTPCPVALTGLIAAFAVGKVAPALAGLTVFSLGLGSVLFVLGILMIKGTSRIQDKWMRFKEAPVLIAKFSTILVLLLGVYLVSKPLFFPEGDSAETEEVINLLLPQSKAGH